MPFESTHAQSNSCDFTSMTSPSTKAFSPFSPFSPSTKGLFTNLPNIHRPWRSKPTAQDVIARIVAKDQALANAYSQPTQPAQCNNAPGSAKIATTGGSGRSPLRSVQTAGSASAPTTATTAPSKSVCAASTAKANSTTTASNGAAIASAHAKAIVTTTAVASVSACASAPKTTNAGIYCNKSLPPTPHRSSPLNPNFKANNANAANVPTNVSMISKTSDGVHSIRSNGNSADLSMVIDSIKPLDIETCRRTRTLAAKRLSRSAHCNRSIPAPIFLPPLPLLAPQAVQEESPQAQPKGKESKHTRNASTNTAVTRTTSMLLEEIRIHDHEASTMEITPVDVTPLDIPVDWDDLRDRWTSPVEKTAAIPFANMADIANLTRMPKFAMSVNLYDDVATPEPARGESAQVDAGDVFSAFQQDVTRLFALSPSLVKSFRESVSLELDISSGSSASGDDASISEHDTPTSVDEEEGEEFDAQSTLNISDLYGYFPTPPPLTAEVSRNVKRHARFVSLEDLDLDDLVSPVTRRLSHQIQLERGLELERQMSMTASVENDDLVTIEGSEVLATESTSKPKADQMSDSQVRRDSCVLPCPPSPRNLCMSAESDTNSKDGLDNVNNSHGSKNSSLKTSPKIKALGRLITDSAIDSHRAVPKLAPSVNRHGARAKELEPKKGESFLSMFSPLSPLQTGTIDIEFD